MAPGYKVNQNNISIIDNEKVEDSPDTAIFMTMGLVQWYPDHVAFSPKEGRINVTTAATRTVLKSPG
jgi:DNA-binding beta-propeller fold protein YncE